jgi:hypothetical protein
MSNTGQIKRYTSYDDDRITVDRNGKFVEYEDHVRIVSELRQRIAGQLKLLQVAGKRIEHLESLLPDEV